MDLQHCNSTTKSSTHGLAEGHSLSQRIFMPGAKSSRAAHGHIDVLGAHQILALGHPLRDGTAAPYPGCWVCRSQRPPKYLPAFKAPQDQATVRMEGLG